MKKYVCDNCGAEGTSGTISRPNGWTALNIQGYIDSRQSTRIEKDFCKDCTDERFPERNRKSGYAEELESILIDFINEEVSEAMSNA